MPLIPRHRRLLLGLIAMKLALPGALFAPPGFGSAGISVARAAPVADAGLDAALREFDAARADEKRVDAAVAALSALVADPLRRPLQEACLGSAQTLQGKAAWMPWNKMKYTEKGLDQIDAALAQLRPEHANVLVRGVSVNLRTRLVAAATFVAVPDGLFHRRADARKQLAALRADPLLAGAPVEFRAELEATEKRLAEAAQ